MNQDKPSRTTITETSVVSISIFTAICLGLMVVLMTRSSFQVGLNPASIASGALLLAILSFIFSNDFFLLTIFYSQYEVFGIAGSMLYGLGEVAMIIGISIALKALATTLIAYLFLGAFTLGFITYNAIRICKIGLERPARVRLVMRGILLLLLVCGYIMIWKA
jgi:hypothetical protein